MFKNRKPTTVRVLCTHPYIGSEWLFNAQIEKHTVTGFVSKKHPVGRKLVWSTSTFPKSCIQKIEFKNREPIKKWDDANKC